MFIQFIGCVCSRLHEYFKHKNSSTCTRRNYFNLGINAGRHSNIPLVSSKSDNKFRVMDWPFESPDLNQIGTVEHGELWEEDKKNDFNFKYLKRSRKWRQKWSSFRKWSWKQCDKKKILSIRCSIQFVGLGRTQTSWATDTSKLNLEFWGKFMVNDLIKISWWRYNKPDEHQDCRRFADWALKKLYGEAELRLKIISSDKAHFLVNWFVNKQNCWTSSD